MLVYNETTKRPEITGNEGYNEASSLLKELQASQYLPEHQVIDSWCDARNIERHQRMVQLGLGFVPQLMQAMINYLEQKLEQK